MKDKKERKEFIAHPINKALSKVQTVSSRERKKIGLEAQKLKIDTDAGDVTGVPKLLRKAL